MNVDEQLPLEQVKKYKDESARRKFYNMKELVFEKRQEYTKNMRAYHMDKIKSNKGKLQTEVVMRSNNSLQCLMAYDHFLSKSIIL